MKKIIIAAMVAVALLGTACNDADVASKNLSKAADNFEIMRRVVFYNGITGEYILTLEGLCSIGNDSTDVQMSVTCRTGDEQYKKHFLGLSDNVTYFAEQLEAESVSAYHYRVVFKPQVIVPDIDSRIDTTDGPRTQDD